LEKYKQPIYRSINTGIDTKDYKKTKQS